MSCLLFVIALLSALLTLNLYQPMLRHKWGHILSFVFGWLAGELLPFVLVAEVLLVLLLLARQDVHGLGDALSVCALLASWAAMLVYYVRSGNAAAVMEATLQRAFGLDYRSHIRPELSAHFPVSVLPRQLLRPFRLDLAQVLRTRDIVYAEAEGIRLKLDIYQHRDKPGNCPVLLQIHGGGWTEKMGSKNEQARPLMNHMAARGWICVSIDYRLSPTSTFPAHIIDCKQALAWVKENIAQYGGNPDFIVATGGSAGGHLCALLALSANDPRFQPGFEQADTRVNGCVPFYGVCDFTNHLSSKPNQVLLDALESYILKTSYAESPELYRQSSPISRAHAGAPPFLVIHGDKDSLCAVAEARRFAEVLGGVSGQAVGYAEIAGAQHAFDIFRSLRSELVMYGVERFLAFLYSGYLDEQVHTRT